MAMSDPTVPEPSQIPPTTTNLTEYQRNAVAMMAVGGLPINDIAMAVGRSAANIKRVINEDPDIQARMAALRARVVERFAVHRFDMLEKMNQARAVIDEGLAAPDLKTRLDTSWRVIEHVMPKEIQRHQVEVSVESKQEVSRATDDLLGSITELKDVMAGRKNGNGRDHIVDELPGPIAVPQVAQGDQDAQDEEDG
jgi:hypothetical protein